MNIFSYIDALAALAAIYFIPLLVDSTKE